MKLQSSIFILIIFLVFILEYNLIFIAFLGVSVFGLLFNYDLNYFTSIKGLFIAFIIFILTSYIYVNY